MQAGRRIGDRERLIQKAEAGAQDGFVDGAEGMAIGFGDFALRRQAAMEEAQAFQLLRQEEALFFGFMAGAEFFFRPWASRGASPWRRICSYSWRWA